MSSLEGPGAARAVSAHGADGRHVLVVASAEELAQPSSVRLPEPEPAPGLILPDGSINWGCPCLGGMATGPCGNQFRDAFSCFHYSAAEPKGSECYDKFSVMQQCMAQYPELYGKDDDELSAAMDEAAASEPPEQPPAGAPEPSTGAPEPPAGAPEPPAEQAPRDK